MSNQVKGILVLTDPAYGGLIIYMTKQDKGGKVELHGEAGRFYAYVNEHSRMLKSTYIAVFPQLTPGKYDMYIPNSATPRAVSIFAGHIAQVDFR